MHAITVQCHPPARAFIRSTPLTPTHCTDTEPGSHAPNHSGSHVTGLTKHSSAWLDRGGWQLV